MMVLLLRLRISLVVAACLLVLALVFPVGDASGEASLDSSEPLVPFQGTPLESFLTGRKEAEPPSEFPSPQEWSEPATSPPQHSTGSEATTKKLSDKAHDSSKPLKRKPVAPSASQQQSVANLPQHTTEQPKASDSTSPPVEGPEASGSSKSIDPHELVKEAGESLKAGDFVKAHNAYVRAIKAAGSDKTLLAAALSGAGRACRPMGKHEEAIQHLDQAIPLHAETKNFSALRDDNLLAGQILMDMGQWDEALTRLEEARKIVSPSETALLQEILEHIATCQVRRGKVGEALGSLTKARSLAQSKGDMAEAARISVTMGEVQLAQSDYAGAKATFEKALKWYRELDRKHEQGETFFRIACGDHMAGHYKAAQEAAKAGRPLVAESETAWGALPLVGRGLSAASEGNMTQAVQDITTALNRYEKIGDQTMAARVRLLLAKVERDRSRYKSALELAAQALGDFRKRSSPHGEAESLRIIAEVYFSEGFVQKALDYGLEALTVAAKTGDKDLIAQCRVQVAEIYHATGDAEQAAKSLKETVTDVKAGVHRRTAAIVRLALARYRLSLDASERALEEARQALKEFSEIGDRRGVLECQHVLGMVHELRGEREQAATFLQKALDGFKALGDRGGEGRCLTALGVHYKNKGESDKAFECFNKSLDIRTGIGDQRGAAANLANLGNLLRQRNQPTEALDYLERALTMYREIGDRRGEADVLANLANVDATRGANAAALERLAAALKIHREIHDTRGVVADLTSMGRLYLARGELDNAAACLQEAEKNNKSLSNPRGELAIMIEQAMLLRARGNHQGALSLLNKALESAKAQGDARTVASIHLKMATIFEDAKEYDKALKLLRHTLQEFRQHGDRQGELWALGGIAVIQVKTEDYENALANLEKALKLRSELGLATHQSRDLDFYLGEIYEGFREFERALEHYHRALISSQTNGDESRLGLLYDRLGTVYYYMENYPKAREFLEEALRSHAESNDTVMQRSELIRLGDIASKLGEPEKALKYQQRALALTKDLGDERIRARILTRIGTLYQVLGRPQSALEYYREARDIRTSVGDRRGVNENLLQSALVLANLGDFQAAVADLKKAFEIAQTSEDRSMLWKAYFIMGRALEGKKSPGEALESYRKALTILESMEADIIEESEEDDFIFGGKTALFETTLRVLSLLARKDPQGAYDNQAFRIVEKLKAAEFENLLSHIHVESFSDLPQDLLVKEKSLKLGIRKLNTRLADEFSRLQPDQGVIRRLIEQRREKEQAFAQLKERLLKEYPSYADLRYPRPVSVPQFQKTQVRSDEAILAYLVTRSRTYLFAIDKNRFHSLTIEYPVQEMQRDIETLLKPLYRSDTQANWDPSVAYRIYTKIMKPVQYFLVGKKTVIIVPHGPLAALPFEILISSESHASKRFWSPKEHPTYLLESYAFSYVPSVSVLSHIRGRKRTAQPGWNLVAFGDALYNSPDKTSQLNAGADDLIAGLGSLTNDARGVELKPLPGARHEISEIVKILGGPTQVYLGAEATETLFKKADLSRYAYVHLATHGVQLNGSGKLRRHPALVFSLFGDTENDGFLQLGEAFGLKLNADTVVISSCLSNRRAEGADAEGNLALSRAFLFAGSDSVVLSLWQVNDSSTAKLFIEMYRNLEAGSKAEALRQAKLMLLGEPATSHPYFWGPFVLTGEWTVRVKPSANRPDPGSLRFQGISNWRRFLSM